MKFGFLRSAALLPLFAVACGAANDPQDSAAAAADTVSGVTVTFAASRNGIPEPIVSGVVTAGTTMTVSYDGLRLVNMFPRCAYEHDSPDGVPRTSIDMGVKFNNDPSRVYTFKRVSLYGATDLPASARANNLVALPFDAVKVELWFSCTSSSGFQAYDSHDGANFVFSVTGTGPGAPTPNYSQKTIVTGRKNTIDAARTYGDAVFPGHDDHYYYPMHLDLAYDVFDDFANGKDRVIASVGLHKHTQGHDSRRDFVDWQNVELRRDGSRLVGSLDQHLDGSAGIDETRVDAVEVAVTDGGDGWDSNLGANYFLSF
jgi:hypothetical protein